MLQNEHIDHALSKASEDYLEAIYRIANGQGDEESAVRSVDIAEQLSVSKASVNKALSALKEQGMVEQNRYGRITLTQQGVTYGKLVWCAHRILRTFLHNELGVDFDRADAEACLMEHVLSADTIGRLVQHLEQQGIAIDA